MTKEELRLCAWCGTPIRSWRPERKRYFCDAACRLDYWNDVRREKAKAKQRSKPCIVCGTPTKLKYRYCSKSCSSRARTIYYSMRNLEKTEKRRAAKRCGENATGVSQKPDITVFKA